MFFFVRVTVFQRCASEDRAVCAGGLPMGQPLSGHDNERWLFRVAPSYLMRCHRRMPSDGGPSGHPATTRSWPDKMQAIAALAVGIGAIAALLFTWRSVNATNDQLRVAEQGQITDRYTAAITDLGSNSVDVKLGGVYALQRIMKDSPRDQPTIIAVLCAFVRDNADEAKFKNPPPGHPSADIQAALTVVGTRDTAHDGPAIVVDFNSAQLTGANLADMNFAGANFAYADLTNATLTSVHLDRADLRHSHLGDANLTGAYLTRANLTRAYLGHAILTGAHLVKAIFVHTCLVRAVFAHADYVGADFTHTIRVGALGLSTPDSSDRPVPSCKP